MSTLGYFAWYKVAHSTYWITDADQILYTEVASHAYYWHPLYLSDPTFVGDSPSIFSWPQVAPGELFCKVFHLRPIFYAMVMRIFGGLVIGFGWYALIWQDARRSWMALIGAVFLLTDSGWLITRPFVYQWTTLASVVIAHSAAPFARNPSIFRDWRILSPLVVMPFLFLYLWTVRRSVEAFSWPRVIFSGAAFGILVLSYVYFWTAAGLALLLGILVDRARWRAYFHTGWIGAVFGAPEFARILFTHRQGSQWMQRFDYFVPISRWSEHGHFTLSLALTVITFVVVRRYSRRLLYLWCLCAAGFVMIHQQLFTGLQMQNYHWAYLFCPCMILLLILLTIQGIERAGLRGRLVGQVLVVAVLLNAAAGLYLRAAEAVRNQDTRHFSREFQDYQDQHDAPQQPRLAPGAVTAGTEDYVQFAMIVDHVLPLAAAWPVILSPSVSDLDYDRRIAFNAYLSGVSREQFEAQEKLELDHLQYGVELRDPSKRPIRLASRLACFDQISSNPSAAIEHYQVRYVALPAGSPRPVALSSDWTLRQSGSAWQVWEHDSGANEPNSPRM